MGFFTPPPDVSARVRKLLDVLDGEIADAFTELSTGHQGQYWTALQGYARAQARGAGRTAPLVAAPEIDDATRRALEVLDGQIQPRVEQLQPGERVEFWRTMGEFAARQADQTRRVSAHLRRHASS